MNYDTGWKTRSNAAGSGICPQFNLIQLVVDADYIINVPKLKTHSMTVLSGGIKNLFGCVPGLQKPEMHYRYQDQAAFARMLVELAHTVAPNVTVMDATEAMEGNGPTGGSVRKTGVLMASKDVLPWILPRLHGLVFRLQRCPCCIFPRKWDSSRILP